MKTMDGSPRVPHLSTQAPSGAQQLRWPLSKVPHLGHARLALVAVAMVAVGVTVLAVVRVAVGATLVATVVSRAVVVATTAVFMGAKSAGGSRRWCLTTTK